jgi:hypothetical protein
MDVTTVVDLTPSSKLALKVCETSCRVFWVCPKDKGELRGFTPPYGTTIWRIIRTRWVTITEQELTWSWRLQSAYVILLFIASDCVITSIVQFLDISASSLVSVLYRHWQIFPSPSFLLRISFREGGGKLLPDSPTSYHLGLQQLFGVGCTNHSDEHYGGWMLGNEKRNAGRAMRLLLVYEVTMLFLSMHPSLKSGYAICNSQAGKWHESLADELMRAAGSRFFLGWQNHHSPSTLNLCIILERGQYTGR